MLAELFYWFLNMSIVGSLMGCIILILRRISSIPRFGIYLLWGIPLIRFWIPFGFANKYSLMNLIARVTTKTIVVYEGETLPSLSVSNYIMGADSYFPIAYKTSLLETVFQVAGHIWVIVALGAFLAAMLLYFFTITEVKSAVRLKDNIYRSDKVTTPTVYGIIRPRIILPEWASPEDTFILQHERVHISRRDNLLRAAAIITACFHWFNPLIWVFLDKFFEDMELACDAKVIKNFTPEEKKAYASTLLKYAVRQKSMFASAFGSAKIRVRIENILSYKKLTIFSCLCFVGLLSAIAFVLLTNSPY